MTMTVLWLHVFFPYFFCEETAALVFLQAWGGGQVQAKSWEVAGVGGVERCLGEYLAEWGARARPCWNGWENFDAGGECLQPHRFFPIRYYVALITGDIPSI